MSVTFASRVSVLVSSLAAVVLTWHAPLASALA